MYQTQNKVESLGLFLEEPACRRIHSDAVSRVRHRHSAHAYKPMYMPPVKIRIEPAWQDVLMAGGAAWSLPRVDQTNRPILRLMPITKPLATRQDRFPRTPGQRSAHGTGQSLFSEWSTYARNQRAPHPRIGRLPSMRQPPV